MSEFLTRYGAEIIQRTTQHLILVGIAMSLAILIGVPLGVILTRKPKLSQLILGSANIIQTIPSLALFGFLIPIPFIGGIGDRAAIVAMTLYSLLPIISNTVVGIAQIDPAIKEAGKGMGMTDQQLLLKVEIPLAFSVILTGIRVATVLAIGLGTIAAAIGAGGLGVLIFRGLATVNNQLLLAGAVPAALIAVLADFGLGKLEKAINQTKK